MSLNDWLQWGAIGVLVLLEVGRRRIVFPMLLQQIEDAQRTALEAVNVAEDVADRVEDMKK